MTISCAGGEAIRLLLEVNGIIQVSINGDEGMDWMEL